MWSQAQIGLITDDFEQLLTGTHENHNGVVLVGNAGKAKQVSSNLEVLSQGKVYL
ncbi:MAG: hypothetical protein AAFW70_18070 [Cyanobacteria bacterium J06635_10]